jgi:hypothetical protein
MSRFHQWPLLACLLLATCQVETHAYGTAGTEHIGRAVVDGLRSVEQTLDRQLGPGRMSAEVRAFEGLVGKDPHGPTGGWFYRRKKAVVY